MKLSKQESGLSLLVFVGAALQLASPSAVAADRPFLEIDTAMVEDDDERTFEFSSWVVNLKQERTVQASLGYNFNPTLSAEVELGWAKNKEDGNRERSVDLGIRKVWLDPAREGWGLGTNVSLGWTRADELGWKYQSVRAVMTYSVPLWEKDVWLHANGGFERAQDDGVNRGIWALGAQAKIRKDVVLFSEYARHANADAFINGGMRWWAKKEKVALDFSVGRLKSKEEPGQNVLNFGLSFYDLSF